MEEKLEGIGKLEKSSHPDGSHEVKYDFSLRNEIAGDRESNLRIEKDRTGTIVSELGKQFDDGDYRLTTADDEVIEVRNSGGVWTVVES